MKKYFQSRFILFFVFLLLIIGGFYFNATSVYALCGQDYYNPGEITSFTGTPPLLPLAGNTLSLNGSFYPATECQTDQELMAHKGVVIAIKNSSETIVYDTGVPVSAMTCGAGLASLCSFPKNIDVSSLPNGNYTAVFVLNPVVGDPDDTRSITFSINIPPPAAPVVTLSAKGNPHFDSCGTLAVKNNDTINLTWSATNNPTTCTASGDWSGTKDSSGTNVSQGIPTSVKTYSYTLTCTNAGGSGSATASIEVISDTNMPDLQIDSVSIPDTFTAGVAGTMSAVIRNVGGSSTTASPGLANGGSTSFGTHPRGSFPSFFIRTSTPPTDGTPFWGSDNSSIMSVLSSTQNTPLPANEDTEIKGPLAPNATTTVTNTYTYYEGQVGQHAISFCADWFSWNPGGGNVCGIYEIPTWSTQQFAKEHNNCTAWKVITVLPGNASPVANAGPDKTATVNGSVSPTGTSATDSDGTIVSTVWSKVGTSTATITNGSTLTPTFSFTTAGTYTFRLTVTDNDGATGVDNMTVTVGAATCSNGANNPTDCDECTPPLVWNPATSSCVPAGPTMSGTITATSCEISTGNSSCETTLNWGTTNPVATSAVTTPTDITVATGNSGTTTYAVLGGNPNGLRTFYLYNNSVLLAQATATASCGSGLVWIGGKCVVGPSGELEVADDSCTIASGASTCDTNVSWSTSNLTTGDTEVTHNNPDNSSFSLQTSGTNVPTSVNYGSTTYYLYHNIDGTPTILSQDSIVANCATGTSWNDEENICMVMVADYWTYDGVSCNASCAQTARCEEADGNPSTTCSLPAPTQACSGGGCQPICQKTHPTTAGTGCISPSVYVGGTLQSKTVQWEWYCSTPTPGISLKCIELKKKPIIIED